MASAAAGCSGDIAGVPLERGLWQTRTSYSTPKIDGLAVDDLRKLMPADVDKTECTTPVVRSGNAWMRDMNFNDDACTIAVASSVGGAISGEGVCQGLAEKVARRTARLDTPTKTDSWIKIAGRYTPRYMSIDSDVTITMQQPSGSTERLTIAATHRATRIGDCV